MIEKKRSDSFSIYRKFEDELEWRSLAFLITKETTAKQYMKKFAKERSFFQIRNRSQIVGTWLYDNGNFYEKKKPAEPA